MLQTNRLLRWIGRLCLLCLLVMGYPQAAVASIHTYPEGADQVMWRSLQTLRDSSDQAWQVVFYKRVKAGQLDCLNLRLVGYPDKTDLAHSLPLEITAGTGKSWTVAETFTTPFLTPNAAEYDMREMMRQLAADLPLQIAIPQSSHAVKLTVPPFAVKEWREVSQRST